MSSSHPSTPAAAPLPTAELDTLDQLVARISRVEIDDAGGLGTLAQLPDECLEMVVSYLGETDLYRLSQCSRRLFLFVVPRLRELTHHFPVRYPGTLRFLLAEDEKGPDESDVLELPNEHLEVRPLPEAEEKRTLRWSPTPAQRTELMSRFRYAKKHVADPAVDPAAAKRALAAAQDGDIIFLRPGEHVCRLVVEKSVFIIGDGPRSSIVVRCSDSGNIVHFMGDNKQVRVSNLTLINDARSYFCLSAQRGVAIVTDCEVSGDYMAVGGYNPGKYRLRRNWLHEHRKCLENYPPPLPAGHPNANWADASQIKALHTEHFGINYLSEKA